MRRLPLIALLSVISAVIVAAFGFSGATAATACPTFHVMHNDRVGIVAFPAGQYTVVPNGITCAEGSALFTRFLSDWDGNLPGGWIVTVDGTTKGFANAAAGTSFTVKPGAVKPSSNTTNNGVCPGNFTVLHNDHIGALRLPKGQYTITTKGLHCWFDAEKLHLFLNGFENGRLPKPWTVNASMKRVLRSPNHYFSLKRTSSSASGGQHPARAISCTTAFRVVKNATIDGFPILAGRYNLNAFAGYTCGAASTSFKSFLSAGSTPVSWVYFPDTGTFTSGNAGFQVEPFAG